MLFCLSALSSGVPVKPMNTAPGKISFIASCSLPDCPFRSPLLRESRLIYFPRGTEMFHFPRLSSPRLCVQRRITSHYRRWVSPFGHPRVTGHSAPHRGLSQPFTPFIDSWCQGIHHVPLLS